MLNLRENIYIIDGEKIKAALGFHFPTRMVWCPPRQIAKRPNLRFTQDLADQGALACADQIDQVIFRNTITDEVVFFHRASNTILVTDIIQSMPRDWYSGWRRWIARMDLMTERVPTMPRKYRLGFRGSNLGDAYRIAARWPVQNLIMAHGPVVTENAHSFFKNAFAPVIG